MTLNRSRAPAFFASLILPLILGASSVQPVAAAAEDAANSFRKTCEQLGGFSEADFQCACFGSGRKVDPRKAGQTCIEDNLRFINEFAGMPKANPCARVRRSPGSGRLNLPSFENELACEDPARFFCDPTRNPLAKKVIETSTRFQNFSNEVEASPELAAFFKEKTGSPVGACWMFQTPEDTTECYRRVNAVLEKKIFTEDRRKESQEIFEASRKAMIRVVEDRLSFARNALGADSGTMEYLNDSLETLKNAKLTWKMQPRHSWNASANSDENDICIEGAALLADNSPGALYALILHELGHLIGIKRHFQNGPVIPLIPRAYDSRFPFDREVHCLIPDSLKADPACYQRLSEQAGRFGQFTFSVTAGQVANLAQLNPYLPYLLPAQPGPPNKNPPWMSPENDCPRPMHEEALADWFAAEAMSRLMDLSGSDLTRLRNQAVLEAMSAFLCSVQYEAPDLPRRKVTATGRSVSPARATEGNWKIAHPTTEYRINRVLFANPVIREAVGCSSEGLVRTPADPGNWDEFTPRYCGTHLYERKSSTEAP